MKMIVLMTALAATPVMAQQQPCAPHEDVVRHLAEQYGEGRRFIALDAAGSVVEVFASDGGSWTITVTAPGGPTCFVAAGDAFQTTDEPLPPLGEEG